MARYVAAFHPAIVGLTGTPEQIAAVAKEYRAYYAKVPLEGGAYTMDHSASLYLMAPDGRNLNVFAHTTPAEAVAETLRTQPDDFNERHLRTPAPATNRTPQPAVREPNIHVRRRTTN